MVIWRSFLQECRIGRQHLLDARYSALGCACDKLYGRDVRRRYSTCPCPTGMKVTICGAAGCTGMIYHHFTNLKTNLDIKTFGNVGSYCATKDPLSDFK